ncbi:MAG: CAP domain-containing protein [Lentisphaerae bacterium]|nr:CAP domain-containing protein [Lentisphaerota bacterium]
MLSSYDFFSVNLDEMVTQFSTLTQTLPPLSINAKLTVAARLHSQDMFANVFQGHYTSANGVDPNEQGDHVGNRVSHQGYSYATVGENVGAYTDGVWAAHAGFEVDWGYGPYGMQSPPGHRENIHSADMREVGVGIVSGVNSANGESVGPLIVTQDLGRQQNATPFITGVVYFDLNGNSFYDVGEGIGGVRVDVAGSGYFAQTAMSGGYSVPVAGNGTYQVAFSGLGLTVTEKTAVVTSNHNVKVDYTPPYTPPIISGDTTPAVGGATVYSFTDTPGATVYTLRQGSVQETEWTEGAENGPQGMTIDATGSYEVVSGLSKSDGSFGFHLAHPQTDAQSVTFNATFIPSSTSQLLFAKRLGYAGEGQEARLELSTNAVPNWETIWSQTGDGTSGESSFTTVTIPLPEFAEKTVKLRVIYDYAGGTYYPQTSESVGFFFDNISVTNTRWATETTISTLASSSQFTFTPTEEERVFLQVQPGQADRHYPAGVPFVCEASPQTTSVTVTVEGPEEARWKLTAEGFDSGWKTSETTLQELPSISYTLTFNDISGWTAPPNRELALAGPTMNESATYVLGVDSDMDHLPDDWEQTIVDADPADDIDSILDVTNGGDLDQDGKTNYEEYQGGTDPTMFNLTVGPVWNMVSIPRELPVEKKDVAALFPAALFASAWVWTGSVYTSTDTLSALRGHWVLLGPTEQTVLIPGMSVNDLPVDLDIGWNLVGIPEKILRPVAPEIRGTIWFWDAATQNYQAVPDDGTEAFLWPGRAYWIESTAALRLYP